jgi:hypothetical protein
VCYLRVPGGLLACLLCVPCAFRVITVVGYVATRCFLHSSGLCCGDGERPSPLQTTGKVRTNTLNPKPQTLEYVRGTFANQHTLARTHTSTHAYARTHTFTHTNAHVCGFLVRTRNSPPAIHHPTPATPATQELQAKIKSWTPAEALDGGESRLQDLYSRVF